MPLIDEEILKLNLAVDATGAIQGMRKVDAAFSRSIRDIQTQTERLNKLNRSYFGNAVAGWRKWRKESETVADLPGKLTKQMRINLETIKKQRVEMRGKSEEEVKAHKAKIQQLLKENAEIRRTQKQVASMGQETVNIKLKEAGDELAKSIENATEPLSALFSKDVPKALKSGGVMFGRVVEKSFLGLGKGSGALGKMLTSKSGKVSAAMAARGGGGGEGAAIAGAMKGLGGFLSKMGPMIQTMSSLGPILGIAAGALAAVVKLLIDAEAQAKEFQKDLLSTASTGEFLAGAGRQADVAFEDMKDTVKDLRDAAFDAGNNLDWGTTAKDHLAFRNVLTQEGVSIKRMADEFEHARATGKATGDAVKYYSQQTATAVAFSRNFGVQLNEIGAFQASLMTDMGMSFESVDKHFAMMAQSASESGMAMNKFFSIMRSVSTDLSLYNMRMDVAVRLLGRLGKAMSPQTAQKFMQTLSQGFKNMGRLEKLRMTLLAGEGKTRKIVQKDIAQKKKALTSEMGERIKGGKEQAGQLLDAYMKGSKGAGGQLSKALKDVEGGGALRERASRMKFQQKMAGKGTFGLAQSIGDLGIEGMIEMKTAALGRFAKPGATLSDMMGELGPEMMAENMGISQEELTQMAMMQDAINETREELIAQADGDTEKIKKINEMTGDELLKASGIDAEKALSTEKDFARKQTDLTTSMLQKLEIIIQFLMNELYNVFSSIYDLLVDSSVLGNQGAREKRDLFKAVKESGNKEMMDLYTKVGGDPSKFKGAAIMETEAGKKAGAVLAGHGEATALRKKKAEAEEGQKDAWDKWMNAASPEEAAAAQKELQGFNKVIADIDSSMKKATADGDTYVKLQSDVSAAWEKNNQGQSAPALMDTANELMSMAGIEQTKSAAGEGPTKSEMFRGQIMQGKSLTDAAKEAGFSEKEIGMLMAKALWTLKPDQVAAVVGTGVASAKPGEDTAPGKPPEAALTGQRAGATPGQPKAEVMPDAAGASPKGLANTMGALGPAHMAENKGVVEEQLVDIAAAEENNLNLAEGQYATQKDIEDALRQKGIRLDKSNYKSAIGPIMEDYMYSAMSKALFEFWLYSEDSADIEKKLEYVRSKGGDMLNPKSFIETYTKGWEGGKAPVASESETGNAAGGTVTGIRGGMAMVRPPAPGEGWASIGPGERILPAGAGASGRGGSSSTLAITVDVSGQQGRDFNAYLEKVIRNAIYDYEKRKPYA